MRAVSERYVYAVVTAGAFIGAPGADDRAIAVSCTGSGPVHLRFYVPNSPAPPSDKDFSVHPPVPSQVQADGTVRITPQGEIDIDNAFRIRDAVDAVLVTAKPPHIVIDLVNVTLIDSVGIGVLVACYHAASACQVPLEAANPSTIVYRQLWISGLVGLFGLATPYHEHGVEPVKH